MKFFHSRIFMITVLLQIAGPFFFSFGDWDNVIQYVSAFGMSYGLWDYFVHHKQEIRRLHDKLDSLHFKLDKED